MACVVRRRGSLVATFRMSSMPPQLFVGPLPSPNKPIDAHLNSHHGPLLTSGFSVVGSSSRVESPRTRLFPTPVVLLGAAYIPRYLTLFVG